MLVISIFISSSSYAAAALVVEGLEPSATSYTLEVRPASHATKLSASVGVNVPGGGRVATFASYTLGWLVVSALVF